MKKFGLRTGAKKATFKSGAQRDVRGGKPRPDLVSPFMMMRLGEHMRKGAEKYSEHNWAKGMPYSVYVEGMYRHLLQYQMGDVKEDHLSALIFNAMAIIHYEETGMSYLNNLPRYTAINENPHKT